MQFLQNDFYFPADGGNLYVPCKHSALWKFRIFNLIWGICICTTYIRSNREYFVVCGKLHFFTFMTPECKTQKVHSFYNIEIFQQNGLFTRNKTDATEHIDLYIKYELKRPTIAESNGSKLHFKHSDESIKVEGVCGNNGWTLFKWSLWNYRKWLKRKHLETIFLLHRTQKFETRKPTLTILTFPI